MQIQAFRNPQPTQLDLIRPCSAACWRWKAAGPGRGGERCIAARAISMSSPTIASQRSASSRRAWASSGSGPFINDDPLQRCFEWNCAGNPRLSAEDRFPDGNNVDRTVISTAGLVACSKRKPGGRRIIINDHEEVEVAVWPLFATRRGPEQDDLLRIEIGDDRIEKLGGNVRTRHKLTPPWLSVFGRNADSHL